MWWKERVARIGERARELSLLAAAKKEERKRKRETTKRSKSHSTTRKRKNTHPRSFSLSGHIHSPSLVDQRQALCRVLLNPSRFL